MKNGLACGSWVSLALAGVLFGGCGGPQPLEAVNPRGTTERRAASADQPEGESPASPRTIRPQMTRRQIADSAPQQATAPSHAPVPQATYIDSEGNERVLFIVLEPGDWKTEVGRPDDQGGWLMDRSGVLHIERREIPFEIHRIEMEVRGTPYGGVWPEFVLAMYHHGLQRNVPVMSTRSNFATNPEYEVQAFDLTIPAPMGEYRLDFRYINNQENPDAGEDRNLFVRRIVLKGPRAVNMEVLPKDNPN